MAFTFSKGALAAAVGTLLPLAAAGSADARDWRLSVERHYEAAEQAKYVPKGGNPQWDFTLDTVVADMEWRRRTARMLRTLPKPSSDPVEPESGQLADRPEQPTFRFSF